MDKKEILSIYQNEYYGQWRTGEKVFYKIENIPENTPIPSPFPWFKMPENYTSPKRKLFTISVEVNGKKIEFSVQVYLPSFSAGFEDKDKIFQKGSPFVVSFHPIEPLETFLNAGYAVIVFTDYCSSIAQDNNLRKGAFYDLYPYSEKPETQTGVLMAWSWGASKILDALYNGAAKELFLDPEASIITGVSRWGKAAAVCGAFENRFKMVAPSCSGAGGLAQFTYVSEGTTYDFSSKGGPASYTYTKNEPLGSLQSKDEQGWFNGKFLTYQSEEQLPLNQENLINVCADKNRFYFMIGSCINEDWVNAPAMWETFKKAYQYYKELKLESNLAQNIHLSGHAVIQEDAQKIIAFFNQKVYGKNSKIKIDREKSIFGEI